MIHLSVKSASRTSAPETVVKFAAPVVNDKGEYRHCTAVSQSKHRLGPAKTASNKAPHQLLNSVTGFVPHTHFTSRNVP
jgi:hypothetical protein